MAVTIEEFFDRCRRNITEDLEMYYSVQRDSDGSRYIKVPFESKEYYIERYEAETDSPWDEIIGIDDVSQEELDKIMEADKAEISRVYDYVKESREEFERSCRCED